MSSNSIRAAFVGLFLCLLWGASAQVPMTGAGKGTPSAGITFAFAYQAIKLDTTGGATTITYNAGGDPSCGAADANRIVAVAMFARVNSASSPTDVKISGVTGTQVSGAFVQSNSVMQADLWYRAVPTGTTCEVIVTWAANPGNDSGIAVYRIVTGTPAPVAGTIKNAAAAADAGANLALAAYTVPAGGASLNVYANRDILIPGVGDVSWTNASVDFNDGTSRAWSGATVSSAGSVTVTATDPAGVSGGSNEAVMLGAAWGP